MATNGNSKGTEPLDFTKFQNVINGKLVDTEKTRNTVNPSTLEELPPVPVATPEDVDAAVEAAKKAQESWANVPWAERQKAVNDFASAVEDLSADFTRMLTTEQGKPVSGQSSR
jgi:acyl-CoA reductase-like NAD-dependent aldehyde dehydrogenase